MTSSSTTLLENHRTELEYVLIGPETAGVDVAHPRKLKLQDGRILVHSEPFSTRTPDLRQRRSSASFGVEVDGKPCVTLLGTCKGFERRRMVPSQKQMPRSCASGHGSYFATTSALMGELKTNTANSTWKAGVELPGRSYTITIVENKDPKRKTSEVQRKEHDSCTSRELKFYGFFTIISINQKTHIVHHALVKKKQEERS